MIQSIQAHDRNFTFYVVEIVYVFGFMIMAVFQISLWHKKKLILNFVNAYLEYFETFQRKYLYTNTTHRILKCSMLCSQLYLPNPYCFF